ncbi:DUF1854 domain-containing protein [Pseudoclostridium thermosuccinogenes]|uniref:DUF1854 domain-containing protein n=1 Tax=Clostridium thermosuccinogenes TaxID=84032 RepID=UPI000CCC1245|nr:DUF1854 domain-containing protein [Pseudoclostridium thermosuccinogenes]PNT92486.1 hypothetical protein CDQ83_02645 [Pseudoclostridium thermosuccinogenes]
MPDTVVKDIEQYTEINYLTSETAEFERTDGGFLSLTTKDGRKYPRVDLYRAFPFTKPREYISVREPESKEIGVKAKEIGVIRCLDDFPENIAKLIEEQLDRRYFSPVIIKINNIKEEFGYYYWDVLTDVGTCRFTVRGGHNIVPIGEDSGRILIIDVDGNRFEIKDYASLDKKSVKKLESVI